MTADQPHPDPLPLVRRGLAVFPIPAGAKRAEPGWQFACELVTTLDQDTIARTWPAGANIGVGCRASRIVGLDLDQHHPGVDGLDTFSALCHRYRQALPVTFSVRTPHGWHLYFTAPAQDDLMIPSSIGRIGPGIDVRAPGRRLGGYLVGPGSVVGGNRYEIGNDAPIVPLPRWLAYRLAFVERQTPYRPAQEPIA